MTVWVHSMNGVPWTPKKMRQAVEILRQGASVTFAFGVEQLARLRQLDEEVFRKRSDLVLHFWSVAKDRRLTEEDLAALASLAHVRHLKVNGVKNTRFDALGELRRLESLAIAVAYRIDLTFVAKLTALHDVSLSATLENLDALTRCKRLNQLSLGGTLSDLTPLGGNTHLESLRLGSATLRSLGFLPKLKRLSALAIDSATIACTLDPIAKLPALTNLSLTSNRDLRDVSFLGSLTRLKRLRLDQPRVVRLPNLSKLRQLEEIELGGMKEWTNPEVLETLPGVRSIDLKEINPKLTAERFFFLADSKKLRALKEVDVRFIDYGKRRIAALNAHFAEVGKEGLLAV